MVTDKQLRIDALSNDVKGVMLGEELQLAGSLMNAACAKEVDYLGECLVRIISL